MAGRDLRQLVESIEHSRRSTASIARNTLLPCTPGMDLGDSMGPRTLGELAELLKRCRLVAESRAKGPILPRVETEVDKSLRELVQYYRRGYLQNHPEVPLEEMDKVFGEYWDVLLAQAFVIVESNHSADHDMMEIETSSPHQVPPIIEAEEEPDEFQYQDIRHESGVVVKKEQLDDSDYGSPPHSNEDQPMIDIQKHEEELMKYVSIESPLANEARWVAPRDSVEPMTGAPFRTTDELHHGQLRNTDELVVSHNAQRDTDELVVSRTAQRNTDELRIENQSSETAQESDSRFRPYEYRRRAPKIPTATGEEFRSRIEEFRRRGLPVRQIVQEMEMKGLVATKRQYENRFRIWDSASSGDHDPSRLSSNLEGYGTPGSDVSDTGADLGTPKPDSHKFLPSLKPNGDDYIWQAEDETERIQIQNQQSQLSITQQPDINSLREEFPTEADRQYIPSNRLNNRYDRDERELDADEASFLRDARRYQNKIAPPQGLLSRWEDVNPAITWR